MRCTKCNAELLPGAKFCGKCGTPAVAQSQAPMNGPTVQNAVVSPQASMLVPPQPTPKINKNKKKSGNTGLIIAIVIMCILLIGIIGAGVYFFVINPDALDSLFGNSNEFENIVDDEADDEYSNEENEEHSNEEVDEKTGEDSDKEADVDLKGDGREKITELKDYENPAYMNGPKALGRSDREAVLEFVAPVPDDSIVQPDDGSIPVQYFDPSIHEYQLFVEDVSYYEASQKCELLGGHLATIICKEEIDIIQNLLKQAGYDQREVPYQIWLGAYVDQTTGMYAWCTDEGLGISNWKPGEPSGTNPETGQKEEYIMMSYDATTDQWVWMDETYNVTDRYAGSVAYLCEWEVITDENYYEDLKTRN